MPRGAGQLGRQRGHYNTTSIADRERLIGAFDDGRDYSDLAEAMGINNSTVYSIIARHQQCLPVARPRGGRRAEQVVLTDDVVARIVDIVEGNPAFTLRQIKDALNGVDISLSSIARALDGALITMKKLEDAPVERNLPRIKAVGESMPNGTLTTR